jgi:geranyl diphosphate synthase
MQSALKFPISESTESRVISTLTDKLRTPHLNIAEITEMIHVSIVLLLSFRAETSAFFYFSICYLTQVASLIHDDVLDDADTRRGVSSLNLVVGNKVL